MEMRTIFDWRRMAIHRKNPRRVLLPPRFLLTST